MNDRRDMARQRDSSAPDARFEAYPDDEISLFDLWAVLVRRRGFMAVVFLAVLGAAVVFALLRPDVYTYSASIALGRIIQGDEIVPVESPAAVEAKLEQAYIPAVIREQVDSAAARAALAIDVAVPDGSNVITLRSEAPAEAEARYRTLLEAVAQRVVDSHRERIAAVRAAGEATMGELEETVASYRSLIEELRGQRQRLADRAEAIDQRIERLEQNAGNADEPRIERLMQTRDFTLPVRTQALDEELADLRVALAQTQGELSALRARLATMEPTRLVAAPARSFRRSGTGGAVVVALGAVLGLMLAVFAAFAVEFVTRANAAIREEKAT